MIEVVSYRAEWPKLFEAEAQSIKQILGENLIAVHHIGSTSVEGLRAKPIIDILVVVKKTEHLPSDLESLEYVYRGELNIPFRFYFSKKVGTIVHLHAYEADHPEIELNISFRDYLRSNPEACKQYADLKEKLISQPSAQIKRNSLFSVYTLGKEAFIRNALQQTGFNRLRIMHCTHETEWEVARAFRQKYFFDKNSISDPYLWTFYHAEHVHFVLYQGTHIIGYAHIQLWPQNRAALRIIVIDEPKRTQGAGLYFMKQCEKWLKYRGYKSLHTESSPSALIFYKKLGYIEALFNDPENAEEDSPDTPLMQIL